WNLQASSMPAYPQPLWHGEPLEGKTIMLSSEQGVGDVLQFLRFAPLVKARGPAAVVLHCADHLVDLLKTCPGVDRLITQVPTEPGPGFDVHAPLANLPGVFGTTVETIPTPIPYVSADPVRVERWRERLAACPGFKVGVCWQGNALNPMDPDRSFPL